MVFWKWWTTIVVSVVFVTIAEHYINISNFLFVQDSTKISLVILTILIACSIYIGYFAYRLQFKNKKTHPKNIEPIWFASDAVLSIGMVGTLIGFLIVLTTTFTNISDYTPEELKSIIGTLASGMGIALITSLTGLLSSILLKFQLVLLDAGHTDPNVSTITMDNTKSESNV